MTFFLGPLCKNVMMTSNESSTYPTPTITSEPSKRNPGSSPTKQAGSTKQAGTTTKKTPVIDNETPQKSSRSASSEEWNKFIYGLIVGVGVTFIIAVLIFLLYAKKKIKSKVFRSSSSSRNTYM